MPSSGSTMPAAVLFDCYGVLVGKGFRQTYEAAGGNFDADAAFIDDLFRQSNGAQIPQDTFYERIAERLKTTPDSFRRIAAEHETPNIETLTFILDKIVPHFKTAVLSNASAGSIERRIPHEWLKMFDAVIVSAEVGAQKPEPAIYELAAERLGVTPEECVFVDDQERYLVPARKLGMSTIRYVSFDQFESEFERLHRGD